MEEWGIPEAVWEQAEREGAVVYHSPQGGSFIVLQQAGVWRVFANICPHRRLPLDRGGRVMFSADRQFVVCANHGAKFDPLTGKCMAGPCTGKHLRRVTALES